MEFIGSMHPAYPGKHFE